MTHRLKKLAILLTSAAAAVTWGIARLIDRQRRNSSNDDNTIRLSPKLVDSKQNSIDSNNSIYIPIESTDAVTTAIYHQALQYIKQTHSTNVHIREHGLSHLAKLKSLPAIYYSIIGQQLDYQSAIQLARTYEAHSNLFPIGPPYIFSVGNQKILSTGNVEKVNDDDVLLHTIRKFLDQLIDEKQRPLDVISQHYLKLLKSYMDDMDSKTVFDLVQHFEAEHADISPKAIKRYRSNLELYSIFLYALRGYADRYPLDVIHFNGLQILKYLYEKRKDNVSFVRFLGKVLLLLSRDQRTHEAFYAVGWVRILHDMALDRNNVTYSLMASTILANLDRPKHINLLHMQEEVLDRLNTKPLYLSSEINKTEVTEAEQKTEEKKEIVLEKQPLSKKSKFVNKILRWIWYSRPVSDENYFDEEKINNKNLDDHIERKILALDIDTSHTIEQANDKNLQSNCTKIPPWIHDQVYGDKVILLSPTMYNVQQIDPDVRWHQEPIIDIIFFHGLAGSAFKTWRQECAPAEDTIPFESKTIPVTTGQPVDDIDEELEINEETNWDKIKMDIPSIPSIPKSHKSKPSSCWPKDWLGQDISTSYLRMLAVDYESTVSEWQSRSMPRNIIRRSMHDRAKEIGEQLKQAGVGKRPVIWVAHSMGGLLVKYILTSQENEELRANTRGCVFFSVPHFGAELASFGIRHAFIVRPTVEIEELQPNSKNLFNLHETFLQMLKTHDTIKILSFAENEKTKFSLRYQTVVVPSESSQINIGKFFILNKNHIYVCKPSSKDAIEYRELLDLVQTIYYQRKDELKTQHIKLTEEILNSLYSFSSPIEDDVQ